MFIFVSFCCKYIPFILKIAMIHINVFNEENKLKAKVYTPHHLIRELTLLKVT